MHGLRKDKGIIEWRLQLRDLDMLKHIHSITKYHGTIGIGVRETGTIECRLDLYSYQIVEDAINLFGFNWRNKCHSIPSPFPIFKESNFDFAGSFFRGISDGDGTRAYARHSTAFTWSIGSKSRYFIDGLRDIL